MREKPTCKTCGDGGHVPIGGTSLEPILGPCPDCTDRRIWHLRIYVGPVAVRELADRLATDERFFEIVAGTEHILFKARDLGDGWGAIGVETEACKVMRIEAEKHVEVLNPIKGGD